MEEFQDLVQGSNQEEDLVQEFFHNQECLGAFSINSHINQHTGQPKQTYNHLETALKSAEKMGQKHNTHFSAYKCLYCDGYHIGRNRDNKTDYDKRIVTDVEVKDKTLIFK